MTQVAFLGRALLPLPRDAIKTVRMFQELHWENFSREIWTNPQWSEWRAANAEFLIAGQRFDDYFGDEEPTSGDDTDVYMHICLGFGHTTEDV